MKSLARLLSCVFVLSFTPSFALADEPSVVEWARHRVEHGLVELLAQQENSRFSRARPAPRQRRARIVDSAVSLDKNRRAFLPFAIDVRFGSEWHENDVVGCVYAGSGDMYVKKGDSYRPASFLLGKNVEPVPSVCEATPARA